jgi:glycosyltransferase involved in cell wall biosynthesis
MKKKVCVYAICKNELKFARPWMESMSEADLVCVLDTGSSDGTPELLAELGAQVSCAEIVPWRFDAARNRSLDLVPLDADICVCTDLDERFEPGWRDNLEKAWTDGTQTAKYLYNWSLKPDGTPDVQMMYFKIHQRFGFKWTCPVHEVLIWQLKGAPKTAWVEGVVLTHYPDREKSRDFYLGLLEAGASEDPKNERLAYYLGREYMFNSMWKECVKTLELYLQNPNARWEEERSAAMRWIARSCAELGEDVLARRWHLRAIAECPRMRDAYAEAAQMEYSRKNWVRVFFFCEEALKIKEKSKVFVNQGYAWDHTLNDLASIACYQLGMTERSLAHAEAALALAPDDPRLIANAKLLREKAKA